jgi:hypothetical protein
MDDRDRLASYPFVVVRIACRVCSRNGAYRLARLAAKFGPEIGLRDLLYRLWRSDARSKKRKSTCGVYCRTSTSSAAPLAARARADPGRSQE